MKEYKLLDNFKSLSQNVERLNEMSQEGWSVHTFTDNLTLLEREVIPSDTEDDDIEMILG